MRRDGLFVDRAAILAHRPIELVVLFQILGGDKAFQRGLRVEVGRFLRQLFAQIRLALLGTGEGRVIQRPLALLQARLMLGQELVQRVPRLVLGQPRKQLHRHVFRRDGIQLHHAIDGINQILLAVQLAVQIRHVPEQPQNDFRRGVIRVRL